MHGSMAAGPRQGAPWPKPRKACDLALERGSSPLSPPALLRCPVTVQCDVTAAWLNRFAQGADATIKLTNEASALVRTHCRLRAAVQDAAT